MQFPGYDFRSNYLNLAGNRLHFLDEGPPDAAPVVMLHGNPTWSYFYRLLISKLREEYRVIVPDHIGMGLSDKPDDSHYDYTLASRVRDLGSLLDHLSIFRPLTLIVHDWGGMIGFLYALQDPRPVHRLVILNTAAFLLPAGKEFPKDLAYCRAPVLGPLLVRGLNGFCRGAIDRCITRRKPDRATVAAYLYPYNSWQNRISILRFVQDIPQRPGDRTYDLVRKVESQLDRWRNTPTMICWGMKDFIFDSDFLQVWRKHLPGAQVHTFEDAGHYVLEDAGPEISLLTHQFLKESGASKPSKGH